MNADAATFIVGAVCLVIGWYANELWDAFTDWLYDTTGFMQSAVWDLLAVIGLVALCVAGAWLWLH